MRAPLTRGLRLLIAAGISIVVVFVVGSALESIGYDPGSVRAFLALVGVIFPFYLAGAVFAAPRFWWSSPSESAQSVLIRAMTWVVVIALLVWMIWSAVAAAQGAIAPSILGEILIPALLIHACVIARRLRAIERSCFVPERWWSVLAVANAIGALYSVVASINLRFGNPLDLVSTQPRSIWSGLFAATVFGPVLIGIGAIRTAAIVRRECTTSRSAA